MSKHNSAVERLAAHCVDLETQTITAEAKTRELATEASKKRDEAEQARLSASALSTERETLARLLVPDQNGKAPPIAEGLGVEAGYEAALGAAFGDDLEAPVEKSALVHWRLVEVSSKDPALPADVEPLSRYVDAPAELLRSLKQTGVVSPEDGPRLQPHLKTGQRLVSKQGDLWRWDGFSAAGGSVTPAAQRIAGRNRLRDITKRETEARKIAEKFAASQSEMAAELAAAQAHERDLRNRWREAQSELLRTRDALSQIERSAAETENRLRSLAEAKALADDDMIDAASRLSEIAMALSLLDEAEDLEPQLAAAQAEASRGRDGVSEARAKIQTLEREKQMRTARMAAANHEHERWTTRHSSSAQQIATLDERLLTSRADLDVLAELPAQIDERRQLLLSELSKAESARKEAADQLAAAEGDMKTAAHAIRIAQATLAAEREALARVETKLEAARTRRQDEARRIRETFDIAPENCLTLAEIEADKPLPSLMDTDRNVQRLKSDRERLGAVNLQADEDLTVLARRIRHARDREKRR